MHTTNPRYEYCSDLAMCKSTSQSINSRPLFDPVRSPCCACDMVSSRAGDRYNLRCRLCVSTRGTLSSFDCC